MAATEEQKQLQMEEQKQLQMEEQKQHYDYCMVLPATSEKTLDKKGQKIVGKMRGAGLITRTYLSAQDDEVIVLIACPMEKLKAFATKVGYKLLLEEDKLEKLAKNGFEYGENKKMKPFPIEHLPNITKRKPYEFIHASYDMSRQDLQDLYYRPHGMDHPFRDLVRLKLINMLMQAPKREGGCHVAVRKLVNKKEILAFYPLHNQDQLHTLYEKVMDWKKMPWDVSAGDIKEYFGEKIGLYFAFLGHYTTWLILPMLLGLAIQIDVIYKDNRSSMSVVVFSVFVSFWSIFMLEYWKRKEKTAAMKWGMVGFEDEQKDRPEFKGATIKSFINGKDMKYFPKHQQLMRLTASFVAIACMVALVIACVVGIYMARFAIEKANEGAASPVASLLTAIQIQFCNFVFGALAEKLTDLENHRTDTQYEDSLIAKLFAFQFVNSFSSFVYIAFMQNQIEGEGEQPAMDVLAMNLAIIFGSRLISGNIFEVGIPIVMAKRRYEQETRGADRDLSPPEEEYIRQPYDIIKGPLKDYAELAVQFGYVTLFVVALPAAPFLACISNYVEIRTDAYKLIKHHQRPVPTGVEDIGTWQTIFTLVAGAAVISNAGLTFFTMDTFDHLRLLDRVWWFIGFQYTVMAIMYAFALLVPDEPESVVIQLQRQDFIVDKVVDQIAEEDDEELKAQLEFKDEKMNSFEIEASYEGTTTVTPTAVDSV